MPGSFFSRKVRITLTEKGLQYEPHVEGSSRNRSADAFSALNPALNVPVLVDGSVTIFESDLTIEYLLRTYDDNINAEISAIEGAMRKDRKAYNRDEGLQ